MYAVLSTAVHRYNIIYIVELLKPDSERLHPYFPFRRSSDPDGSRERSPLRFAAARFPGQRPIPRSALYPRKVPALRRAEGGAGKPDTESGRSHTRHIGQAERLGIPLVLDDSMEDGKPELRVPGSGRFSLSIRSGGGERFCLLKGRIPRPEHGCSPAMTGLPDIVALPLEGEEGSILPHDCDWSGQGARDTAMHPIWNIGSG